MKEGIKIKRFISLLITGIFALSVFYFPVNAEESKMRGAWIATAFGIDYPSEKKDIEAQKLEFSNKVDKLEDIGINTVFVQVRPKSDAFYKSDINPWSEFITGTQGKNPGYDPLAYMVENVHDRGMEFHAWLNPYRITTSGTDLSLLCDGHPARENPDWVMEYNGALYYDPSNEEVKEYIKDTVCEIVENYDVDGIHFDDYFYPSGYPLPIGEGLEGKEANARRDHVTDMIEMVYKSVKRIDKNVDFGISPSGIYKNEDTGKYGLPIKGSQAYYTVYADSKAWIEKGIIDYIAPQIYWENGHKTADYETVVRYWADMVKGTNVKLYIGEGIYKDVIAEEIKDHVEFGRKISAVSGNIFYSTRDIIANRKGVKDSLKSVYAEKETPVIQTPVLNKEKSAIPNSSSVYVNSNKVSVEAYSIDDYNYFKLRDIAVLLMGTSSKFSVLWDEKTQTIIAVKGSDYMIMGGELSVSASKKKKAVLSNAKIMIDGKFADISAYNIDGNNYYKLRDLADELDFEVNWNEAARAMTIRA